MCNIPFECETWTTTDSSEILQTKRKRKIGLPINVQRKSNIATQKQRQKYMCVTLERCRSDRIFCEMLNFHFNSPEDMETEKKKTRIRTRPLQRNDIPL